LALWLGNVKNGNLAAKCLFLCCSFHCCIVTPLQYNLP
jgi:hypothetical protein